MEFDGDDDGGTLEIASIALRICGGRSLATFEGWQFYEMPLWGDDAAVIMESASTLGQPLFDDAESIRQWRWSPVRSAVRGVRRSP